MVKIANKERAIVEPSVLDFISEVAKKYITHQELMLRGNARYARDDVKNTVRMAILLANKDEELLERIRGEFLSLPYQRFSVVKHEIIMDSWDRKVETVEYLWGLTRPITMSEYHTDGGHGRTREDRRRHRGDSYRTDMVIVPYLWDIGEYTVCIPDRAFLYGSLDYIHFVPARDPKIWARHPHHTAFTKDEVLEPDYHPLSHKSRICTGGFGTLLTSLVNGLSFAEIFRQSHSFLTRFNFHSPLASTYRGDRMDFMHRRPNVSSA